MEFHAGGPTAVGLVGEEEEGWERDGVEWSGVEWRGK